MSSHVSAKNTSLPRSWLCGVASAGCALFARLCLVPRAPAFPICAVEGSPWQSKGTKGAGGQGRAQPWAQNPSPHSIGALTCGVGSAEQDLLCLCLQELTGLPGGEEAGAENDNYSALK